ncbi:MAG: hypothetical protein WKF68_09665 [Daejeonella sp.]
MEHLNIRSVNLCIGLQIMGILQRIGLIEIPAQGRQTPKYGVVIKKPHPGIGWGQRFND